MTDQDKTNATPEQVEERVNQAFTLLLRGFNQKEIVNYFAEKTEWGAQLTKRALRNYVYAAREELAKMATGDIDRREAFTKAVMRLEEQYRKANMLNDTSRAIQAVREMVMLLKLDQPQAAMDWRSEAERLGVNPSELFNELVQYAADRAHSE